MSLWLLCRLPGLREGPEQRAISLLRTWFGWRSAPSTPLRG
jgi:hypothetical protein